MPRGESFWLLVMLTGAIASACLGVGLAGTDAVSWTTLACGFVTGLAVGTFIGLGDKTKGD